MLKSNIIKSSVIFLCATTLIFPSVTFAQTKVSFNLSPTTIEDKIDPGEHREFSIRIENRGDTPSTLYPTARNISAIGPNHQPIYVEGAGGNTHELASWITYKESSIDLLPGKSAELHFTISFPKDAHPGSHLAGLFLTQKPPDNLKEGSAVGLDIGAILHFQVKGDIVEDTRIREFLTDKLVYGSPNVIFTVKAENKGNTLSRPQGLIDITDMFGKKVDSLAVNESAFVISVNSTGEYTVKWKPEGFVFGKFEAVLALAVPLVEGGNQTISSVTQFWILPLNVIAPVLGGLLTFILVLYVLIRLYVRRQLAGVGGGRGGSSYRREARGMSRLAAIAIGLLFAVVVALLILFFYFG